MTKASEQIRARMQAYDDTLVKPEDYVYPESVLTLWQNVLPGVAASLLVFAVVTREFEPNGYRTSLSLLALGFAIFWSIRGYSSWSRRPVIARSDTGTLSWVQRGRLILGLSDSSADDVPLETLSTRTPPRSLLQRWFDCDTLLLPDGRKIRNVVNIEHIMQIRNYRKQLESASVEYTVDIREATVCTLEATEATNEKLDTLIDEIRRLVGVASRGVSHNDAKKLISAIESVRPPDPPA